VAFIVAAVRILGWVQHTKLKPLTDKDVLVLADFGNSTGDLVFDGILRQALSIQLEQSPFLNDGQPTGAADDAPYEPVARNVHYKSNRERHLRARRSRRNGWRIDC
jgi:hypothetical protein